MKHYKGLLCGLAAVVLVLGAVRIVSLNKALPSPEDKPVTVGEKFIYKGLEGTVGDVEIYNKEEMQAAYPDIELEMDGLDDSHISDSTYIVANVKMTNNTQDTVYMGKTGVAQWILEAGLQQDISGGGFRRDKTCIHNMERLYDKRRTGKKSAKSGILILSG